MVAFKTPEQIKWTQVKKKKIVFFIALNRNVPKINPSITAKSSGFQKLFLKYIEVFRQREKKNLICCEGTTKKTPLALAFSATLRSKKTMKNTCRVLGDKIMTHEFYTHPMVIQVWEQQKGLW